MIILDRSILNVFPGRSFELDNVVMRKSIFWDAASLIKSAQFNEPMTIHCRDLSQYYLSLSIKDLRGIFKEIVNAINTDNEGLAKPRSSWLT